MTLDKFIKMFAKFPYPVHIVEIQYGFNVVIGGLTYTFYYPKKKDKKIVCKSHTIRFDDGEELECLQIMIERATKKPSIKLVEEKPSKSVNGVQQCIEHIKAKKEKVDANKTRDTNSVSVMLSQLIDELKQYL